MTYAKAGRMNGVQPEVGTIVGPNWLGELLVVREVDEHGATLGYVTREDIAAMRAAEYPRSLTELRLG